MKMLDDGEDPYVPAPDQLRRLRKVEKMPELDRLKALVRMFLDEISFVPFRAIDCDQIMVDELWWRLREATERRRKKRGER